MGTNTSPGSVYRTVLFENFHHNVECVEDDSPGTTSGNGCLPLHETARKSTENNTPFDVNTPIS